MAILDFGSCNVDMVFTVEHINAPGETQTALAFARYPGGKGLNQAIALQRAGADAWIAGCVGEDDPFLRKLLCDEGVNCDCLCAVPGPTGQAIIQVDSKGENSIVAFPGANFRVTREQILTTLQQFGKQGRWVILQNEISNLPYIVAQAKELGLQVMLNPSPYNDVMKEIDLAMVDVLILNQVEACQVFGTDSEDFLKRMERDYPNTRVMLTLGSRGCIYMERGKRMYQDAYRVHAVDTTGAGDTFTGYFAALMDRGEPMERVLKVASAAAALSVTRSGAAVSIPKLDEVLAWMEDLPG